MATLLERFRGGKGKCHTSEGSLEIIHGNYHGSCIGVIQIGGSVFKTSEDNKVVEVPVDNSRLHALKCRWRHLITIGLQTVFPGSQNNVLCRTAIA